MEHSNYIAFFKKQEIVSERNTKHGRKLTSKKATMETLLVDNKICGLNIELAKVFSNQGRYYLRLGNKQEGYSKNVRAQVDAGVYNPPRHQHINSIQKRLHQLLSDSNT